MISSQTDQVPEPARCQTRRSLTLLQWAPAVLAIAALLPLPASADKAYTAFDTLELQVPGGTLFNGISPFEIDADLCDKVADPNCDVNGEETTGSDSEYDWTRPDIDLTPPLGYGADTFNTPPRFTGIADSIEIVKDWGGGSCDGTPEIPSGDQPDQNAFPGGSKMDDNPWNTPIVVDPTPNKGEICTYYSAFEYVRVYDDTVTPTFDQQQLILYVGLRPALARGDRSYLLPLFPNAYAARTGGEFMLNWDISPGQGSLFRLLQWNQGTGNWDEQGSIDPATKNRFVECEFECVDGACDDANDTVTFGECAVNLTQLAAGVDPLGDKCLNIGFPYLITRTGNSNDAGLIDVAERTQENTGTCGEVLIDKVYYSNDPTANREFTYFLNQADGEQTEDANATTYNDYNGETRYPDNNSAVSIFPELVPSIGAIDQISTFFEYIGGWTCGSCNQTDLWHNVIAQLDYVLMERLPLNRSPDRLWTIKCSYYDIFTKQRVGPVTVYEESFCQDVPPSTCAAQSVPPLANVTQFAVAPNPFMGETDPDVLRTECTIVNYDATIPITLGSFEASSSGSGVHFEWSTVTETSHLGFNLYVEGDKGEWLQINDELIPPLAPGDSFEVREYSYDADAIDGKRFAIGDVGALTGERKHGPFELDTFYGLKRGERPATDWEGIRAQHEFKNKARKLKSQQQFKQKLKKIKQNNGNGDKVGLREVQQPLLQRVADTLLGLLVGSAHAAAEPVGEAGLLYIDVTTSGLQRVTYEQLAAAGYDLGDVSPFKFGLAHHGETVPIYVNMVKNAAGKKVFGNGAYIEFIASEFDSLYSKTDSYSLHVNGNHKLRIKTDNSRLPATVAVTVYQQTDLFEEDASHPETLYSTSAPTDDPWYSAELRAFGKAGTVTLALPVDHYVPNAGDVSVQLGLWGMTLGRHAGSVSLNDSEVASFGFMGQIADTPASDSVLPSLLNEGDNILTLRSPGAPGVNDVIVVDSWSVTYPRRLVARKDRLSFSASGDKFKMSGFSSEDVVAYRIATEGTTERLTRVRLRLSGDGSYQAVFAGNGEVSEYHLSSVAAMPEIGIREVAEQADLLTGKAEYLVIAHPDFIDDSMDKLVSERNNQYGSVKVANSEAVYAQFGGGVFGAQPIADYIRWAADNLGTTTVLLVGSDINDYLDRWATGAMSFLPSLYTRTGALINHAPSDAKYADIDDDNVQDLAIGRLIPRDSAEWALMVDKTLAYDARAMQSVFAADKYDTFLAHDFSKDSDALIASLPESWQAGVTTAYMDAGGDAHTTLMAALNGSSIALASYVGHSGPKDWASRGLLTADLKNSDDDVAGLTNTSPFVVTQWGCWNTYYVSPNSNSMAHEFLRNGSDSGRLGGAAAVLGATALTGVNSEVALGKALYGIMFETGKPLGEAVLEAKQALPAGALDVTLGWNLIGDPGLMIAP